MNRNRCEKSMMQKESAIMREREKNVQRGLGRGENAEVDERKEKDGSMVG